MIRNKQIVTSRGSLACSSDSQLQPNLILAFAGICRSNSSSLLFLSVFASPVNFSYNLCVAKTVVVDVSAVQNPHWEAKKAMVALITIEEPHISTLSPKILMNKLLKPMHRFFSHFKPPQL